MEKDKFIAIILAFLLVCCTGKPTVDQQKSVSPPHEGDIRITGAYALSPLAEKWISEFRKINPSVTFNLIPLGSGDALKKVLSGETDLAMISSDLLLNSDSDLWLTPVASLSVVPIASKHNPVLEVLLKNGITHDDLTGYFTGEKTSWSELTGQPGRIPVNVYIRSDLSGASEILARYLWLESAELKGNSVEGEVKMIEAIKNDPNGLGYCNFIYAFDPETKEFLSDILILPIDINHNCLLDPKENFYGNFTDLQRAMWLGKYPCQLNRHLYFVAKQKPATKELTDFLTWIFKEGQKYIPEMGYIELRSTEVQYCLTQMNN